MLRLFVIAMAVGLPACTGTETGNPFTSEASLVATSSDPAVAAIGAPAGGLGIDQVWLSVDHMQLEPCDDPAATDAALGPVQVETVTSGARIAAFEARAATYCRVEVTLAPAVGLVRDAPVELAGNTMVVSGTRADGAAFVVSSAVTPAIALTAMPDAPLVAGADGVGVLVAFDLARWLGAVDVASGSVGADGVVRIDATNNAELLSAFEMHAADGTTAHEDHDRDGVVDPDEPAVAQHGP